MTVYGSRSGVLSIPRGDPDFALVGAGPYTARYGYTPDDLPQTMAYPNGVNVALGYDANSQLTRLTALGPPNQVPATTTLASGYAYGYNAAGWITSTTTLSGTDALTHDASGRLTDECGPQMVTRDHCDHWTYDKNGNLRTAIGDAGVTDVYTYSVTQINEQVAGGASDSPPTATISLAYDGHGDTTSISNPVALTDPTSAGYKKYALNESFAYDAEQRPIQATRLESTKVGTATIVTPLTATIQYNADGLRSDYLLTPDPRTGKQPVDTRFAYRDGALASATVTDNSGALLYKNTFIYGPSGEPLELIRTDPTGTHRFWYVLDGLGSVVALTDQNGKVVDRYAYDSWGEPTSDDRTNETVPQQLRYAGYYYDEALTYYWVAVRYYDPEGMRWFQPDPSDQDGVRTYAYVGDDPVDTNDPSGLCSIGPIRLPVGHSEPCINDVVRELHNNLPYGRWPDYLVLSAGHATILRLGPIPIPVDGAVNITLSRYGHWYAGGAAGLGTPGKSVYIGAGWIYQGTAPSDAYLESFITGWSITGNVITSGHIGGSIVWGEVPEGKRANDFGFEYGSGSTGASILASFDWRVPFVGRGPSWSH